MKITFLGTSHGVPSATRYCSSTMLEIDGDVYLIDGGAPVADLLTRRGISFEQVKAVFFTHMHSDHCDGIHEFLSLSDWYYTKASYDVYIPEEAKIAAFRQLHDALDPARIRLHRTEPGVCYRDKHITVTAIPTRHIDNGARPSYALLFDTADGKRILFTGDLHQGDAADFPQIAKDEASDAIVCEQAHFSTDVLLAHLRDCRTGRVFVNHVAHNYERSIAALRAAEESHVLPIPMHAVDDGDSCEI